jgi:gliding motility-associated-like protein
MVINGTTYNEQLPDGIETVPNVHGCDSVITIAMTFESVDSTLIAYTGCIGDGYAVTVNESSYDESNPSGIETMQNTNGCDSIIQVALIYEDCKEEEMDCAIYIPNVISPNEDGINDAFGFGYTGSCEITSFRVALFGRWGEEIYSTNDASFKWKGDFKGEQLQPGVYVYVAEIYFQDVSGPVFRRGDVTLIR